MPNYCNINEMKKAFESHQMAESEFDAAIETYSGGDLNPSFVAVADIQDLVYNHNCSENCVVFTSKDENTDNAIWFDADLKTNRFLDGKYINNPKEGDLQTTFSFELLSFVVEQSNSSPLGFYKGTFSYGNRLLIKYQDKNGEAEYLNFGDVGPL